MFWQACISQPLAFCIVLEFLSTVCGLSGSSSEEVSNIVTLQCMPIHAIFETCPALFIRRNSTITTKLVWSTLSKLQNLRPYPNSHASGFAPPSGKILSSISRTFTEYVHKRVIIRSIYVLPAADGQPKCPNRNAARLTTLIRDHRW